MVPATDLLHRTDWRELLDLAGKRKFDLLLVWRMDQAFRSVLDSATTLERLKAWGVGLRSYSEPWLDTTSPFGKPCTTSLWLMPNCSGDSNDVSERLRRGDKPQGGGVNQVLATRDLVETG